jgi:hypothetical protein
MKPCKWSSSEGVAQFQLGKNETVGRHPEYDVSAFGREGIIKWKRIRGRATDHQIRQDCGYAWHRVPGSPES